MQVKTLLEWHKMHLIDTNVPRIVSLCLLETTAMQPYKKRRIDPDAVWPGFGLGWTQGTTYQTRARILHGKENFGVNTWVCPDVASRHT